jgi:hypothetical protein
VVGEISEDFSIRFWFRGREVIGELQMVPTTATRVSQIECKVDGLGTIPTRVSAPRFIVKSSAIEGYGIHGVTAAERVIQKGFHSSVVAIGLATSGRDSTG